MKIVDTSDQVHHLKLTLPNATSSQAIHKSNPLAHHIRFQPRPRHPSWDLFTNYILNYLFPANYTTHLLKFCFLQVILACICILSISANILTPFQALNFFVLLFSYLVYTNLPILFASQKPWTNPTILHYNRLPMHVQPLRLFTSIQSARNGACIPSLSQKYDDFMPNIWNLDGEWKFLLRHTVEEAFQLVLNGKEMDWKSIMVPSHWSLQDFGDHPIYTNKKYFFRRNPPMVPHENPTGVYRLDFQLPDAWKEEDAEYTILFHGVESALFVFLNGEFVGFSKDSRLPAEFAMSPRKGSINRLDVIVVRFSDGNYLEDQDHWWFDGIYRSVEIVRRPKKMDILDYRVQADDNGMLSLQIDLKGGSGGRKLRGMLFEDEQLDPFGEMKYGEGIWNIVVPVKSEAVPYSEIVNCHFHEVIPNVKLWCAEHPNLYTLVLVLEDENGNILQVESTRVGFRSVTVKNGVLCVNGESITICGVNRHEHDPDHGKVISIESMIRDMKLLKQNNFNAIRAAHYPNITPFYHLACYFGLYIVNEANIETDGIKPMGKLACDSAWREAFCSRITRMVERDRNYPCIIMWSLGNESGRGANFEEGRRRLELLDASRVICYEGGGDMIEGAGNTELTDVICPMYPSVEKVESFGKGNDNRPVILCEYSHAMGNSNGNLHLYWEKFWDDDLPRVQGGFIWDMVDQGIRKTRGGREYFGYGGDFGDEENDRQFCINGLFSPDRDPHPSVSECKRLQQPVDFSLSLDQSKIRFSSPEFTPEITFKFRNRYSFSNLDHLMWEWNISSDVSVEPIGSGSFDITLQDEKLGMVTVKLSNLNYSKLQSSPLPVNSWINLIGRLKEGTTWADKGHVIVQHQFQIEVQFDHILPTIFTHPTSSPEIDIFNEKSYVSIKANNFGVSINKANGSLSQYQICNKDLLTKPLSPNFTRASTDNDKGGAGMFLEFIFPTWSSWVSECYATIFGSKDFSHKYNWEMSGLSASNPPQSSCKDMKVKKCLDGSVEVKTKNWIQRKDGRLLFLADVCYKIHLDGKILISSKIIPTKSMRNIPSLPRVGMTMALDRSLHRISYLGRGPDENYPDRKFSSDYGIFQTTPSKMHVDYIVPSENGNRCDVKWASWTDETGTGICFVKSDGMCFSSSLWSREELDKADHTCDLEEREDGDAEVFVNLDQELMGLGGDVSWYPCVYPQYLVKATKMFESSYWLLPIFPGEDAIIKDKSTPMPTSIEKE